MADDFLQTYKAISTKEARIRALQQLVRVVTFEERQAIGAAVSEKNDIVPALPLELVLHIFSHLRILNAWSLQLVNTRWHRILSSESFLRASLCRWDTHCPSDSGRLAKDVAGDSIRERCRHMQAIKLDGPFSETIIENTGTGLQGPQPQLCHRKIDLKGHRIAYISSQPGDGNTVVVRDIISGAASMLRGEARERIMFVILTTTFVAFVTFEGCLYVTEFAEHMFLRKTSRVKLPSSRIRGCGGDVERVVLAMGGDVYESTYITEVLVYHTTTRRLTSLPVGDMYKKLGGNVRSLNSCGMLVDSHSGTIDIFTLMLDMGAAPGRNDGDKSLQIRHLRVSLRGELLAVGSWDYPLPFETTVRPAHFTMAPPEPTGYKGIFRLQVGELPFMGGLPVRLKCDVLFDVHGAVFMLNGSDQNGDLATNIGEPAIEDMRRSRLAKVVPEGLHAQWKGHAITLDQILSDRPYQWSDYMTLMNDSFLVSLEINEHQTQRSQIRIYCFDESIDMHGAGSTRL